MDNDLGLVDKQSPPAIHVPEGAELLRVNCPYCPTGFAEVLVLTNPRQKTKQVEHFDDPRKCRACHRFFKLAAKVIFVGKPLEGDNGR